MGKKELALLVLTILVISGCASVKTGQAVKVNKTVAVENKSDGYIKANPMNITDDPKKAECLEFVKRFLSTLVFPEVGGYPVRVDKESFVMIAFIPDESSVYTIITQFTLFTMKGPIKKQYTIKLKDLSDHSYEIVGLREDK